MSVVKEALENFAVSSERSAIVLKGKWGVGKTFLWEGVLKRKKESLGATYYSYVSLFGLSSLKELKRTIYENLLKREHAADSGGVRSVEDRLEGIAGFLRRNSQLLSGIKGAGAIVDTYQAAAIHDALICIDDFERKSKGLSDAEVLGLISMLVEKRNCKVILILNEDGLGKEGVEFSEYREKVFSYEVEYQPTSEESVKIVFGVGVGHDDIMDRVVKLGITNVRLIRKIKFYYDYLRGALNVQNARLWSDISSTIALSVLARYGGDLSPITLEELEYFEGTIDTPLGSVTGSELQELTAKQTQAETLRDYGYLFTSDLDRAVIGLVRQGYVDSDVISNIVAAAAHQAEIADAEHEFRMAWRDYHNNFSKNQEAILDGFRIAIDSYLEHMPVDRLDGVVHLYREMGMSDEADSLVIRFFEGLSRKRTLADREELWSEPRDEKIRAALDNYFAGFGATMSLKEALEYLLDHRSTAESVAPLCRSSSADLVDYLTSPDTANFKSVVKLLLSASHSSNVFDDAVPGSAKIIFMNTYEALQIIKSMSRLNEHRLTPLMTMDEQYESYKAMP
ncbi:hypothetical protein J2W83_003099 [Pseudomonas hunanensis]|uniref:Uncharacterized protein n=1 Tax=Pseudomonas hunanensis TaxID=1247546 RepID=A0ACC6K537_9PSED|nr:P-loop NTPase fold protein [Pseudomonas hunanensis]MDR6713491.1 hypothetical protein [Pseudomonas hunanensis]